MRRATGVWVLCGRSEKVPVIVRDSPGFLVNRVLFPYLLDAAQLFESGLEAEQIDRALVEWGMPMGPLRLIDEIGVDITIDIGNTLEKTYGQRDHVSSVLLWLRDQKMLGRKTGAGFYKYEGKKQTPNDSVIQWRIAAGAKEARKAMRHHRRQRQRMTSRGAWCF